MPVLGVQNLGKSYGDRVLFKGASLTIDDGERLGVVGRNGSGKSTLAKLIADLEPRDEGVLSRRKDARIAYLAQEPAFDPALSAKQVATSGLGEWTTAKDKYEALSEALGSLEGAELERAIHEQQDALAAVERLGGWDRDFEVTRVLESLGIVNMDQNVGSMSGGQVRRVALAQALLASPDLLMLDEPTNHLDADTINWLENYLVSQFRGALLLVTHDRWLLDQVATRTLEVSHGVLYSYDGGYGDYLMAKSERMALEQRSEQNRQNFLRTEIEWLRRQPKARSTKQKARIERAETAIGTAKPMQDTQIDLRAEVAGSGKNLIDIRGVELRYGDKILLNKLDLTITIGERIGIIGPNGIGKSSLLRAILGDLKPTQGEIVFGRRTKIGYLDQMRSDLDDTLSVHETVSQAVPTEGATRIEPRSYLERFGFDSKSFMKKVGMLSGGERARLSFAKVLASACNILLLDEPSNDLDIDTLSALEELLTNYEGSVLVVTHDRYFLDRVSTSILAFEGEGKVQRYAGAYQAYAAKREEEDAIAAGAKKSVRPPAQGKADGSSKSAKKPEAKREVEPLPSIGFSVSGGSAPEKKKKSPLSNNEQRELDELPAKLEKLEKDLERTEEAYAAPELYTKPDDGSRKRLEGEIAELKATLEKQMARWELLETKKGG
jgi:ABC transport system ATP-binding/permease protein